MHSYTPITVIILLFIVVSSLCIVYIREIISLYTLLSIYTWIGASFFFFPHYHRMCHVLYSKKKKKNRARIYGSVLRRILLLFNALNGNGCIMYCKCVISIKYYNAAAVAYHPGSCLAIFASPSTDRFTSSFQTPYSNRMRLFQRTDGFQYFLNRL